MDKVLIPTASNDGSTVNAEFSAPGPGALRESQTMLDAERYDLLSSESKNNVSLVIKEFSKNLRNMSGKCMDVGCGPGDITKNILLPALDSSTVMIGTDILEEMIEYANKTYGDNEQLKFETLNIQTKYLPEKYVSGFDNIFSFYALHWCYNIRQAFENIYQMLQSNGNMFVLFVANHGIFDIFKMMAKDERFASYITDIEKYVSVFHNVDQPSEKLKELLESIGFYIHHCSHREKSYIDANTFLSMIIPIFPFLNKMPQSLREEFIIDFKYNFINTKVKVCKSKQYDNSLCNNQDQPDFIYLYSILVIHAQKRIL